MLDPSVFRENVKSRTVPINFIFSNGGIGDYINWVPALEWIRDTQKHVDAHLYCTPVFKPVLEYFFKAQPRWKIRDRSEFGRDVPENSLVCFPQAGTQLLNAVGQHLLDLGFNYFCCLAKAPESHNRLPTIDYRPDWDKWPEMMALGTRYAVFTPGATADIRAMPVEAFNELARYTRERGLTPVFLGKREISANYTANFKDYDWNPGVDLRERTTLLEAAAIMDRAKFVIGLDNGLLHLAGTTRTTVIFGHNIASVEHRQLRRSRGRTIDVALTKEELSCVGCQSNMRFLYNHNFKKCLFNDAKCIEMLFENGAERFKRAIDTALK